MTSTQVHGKQNLVDTYLTFLSYIMIITQLISMKLTDKDQILLLSHVPIFLIQAMVKIGILAPLLTHPYYHFQKLKLNSKGQDIETTTDLAYNDSSKQTSEPNTDTETACEPTSQPPSRQSVTPSTIEINNLTTKNVPRNEPSLSRGGRYNLRLNPNPKYSETYRY